MSKGASWAALSVVLTGVLAAVGYSWVPGQKPKTAGPVKIVAQPQPALIEKGDTAQSLNFDFLVENQGSQPVAIDSVEVVAYDSGGRPLLRRFIDSNGFAPGIETIPGRTVPAGQKILVFNPFHQFRPDIELYRLEYRFSLSIPKQAPETHALVTVQARPYASKTALSLPLKGRLLVHDGHDFYAHHRRLNTEHAAAKELALQRNFMRYGMDLTPTNGEFEPYRGSGAGNADWYGWSRPVYATADGVVAASGDSEPDNERGGKSHFDPAAMKTDPMKFYGNHVVIDHGNGEFSLFGHLQKGSLLVKTGDRVTRGQPLGRIGSSGSSNNPHLHYELRTGRDLQVEGLPATFRGFRRYLGAKVVDVEAGTVDTGDLLESR